MHVHFPIIKFRHLESNPTTRLRFCMFSESQKVLKVITLLLGLGSLGCRTPHSAVVINEVNVCRWNCTPLIGGSVRQMQTLTSFMANKARGVLHHPARTFRTL